MNGKSQINKPRLPKSNIVRYKESEIMELRCIFSDMVLEAAIKTLRNGKAADMDDICSEKIRHFGIIIKKMVIKPF